MTGTADVLCDKVRGLVAGAPSVGTASAAPEADGVSDTDEPDELIVTSVRRASGVDAVGSAGNSLALMAGVGALSGGGGGGASGFGPAEGSGFPLAGASGFGPARATGFAATGGGLVADGTSGGLAAVAGVGGVGRAVAVVLEVAEPGFGGTGGAVAGSAAGAAGWDRHDAAAPLVGRRDSSLALSALAHRNAPDKRRSAPVNAPCAVGTAPCRPRPGSAETERLRNRPQPCRRISSKTPAARSRLVGSHTSMLSVVRCRFGRPTALMHYGGHYGPLKETDRAARERWAA